MDHVELTDLRMDTLVGILDREQRAPQPILLDVRMELDLSRTARTGALAHSINYAAVQAWALTLAQQGRWRLIESLGLALARLLLAPPAACEVRAAIDAVTIRIRKPTILDDAVPGIQLRREAAALAWPGTELTRGVLAEALVVTPVQGAWRIHVAPGVTWTVPGVWSLHVLGGRGRHQAETGTASLAYGDVIARQPDHQVEAGDEGLLLLAVGAPAG